MIKSELIARITAQNPHLYEHEVETLVKAIFNRISQALAEGDRVELRGFGMFEALKREARTGRNPRIGEVVAVDSRAHVQFKPGKAMHARLNRAEINPD
ncbi:integration host factor subunit beta [Methylobacterium sp. J-072]|uniref:HU family DNA-binding protein n=1 Tax=Methylobacterium sp. J-072 TaxID=2836651 RepID=UPI001FBA5898|nr:HU family DNA-binding protein [Methylobacterium sp. J-072]MCJ2092805.1 integration host factor subunit beta [Methylobacterium sp. J-072]